MKKEYQIVSWKDWDHTINMAVKEYKSEFKIYPDVMLANTRTYEKIDLTAGYFNRKNCSPRTKLVNPESECVCLGTFTSAKYSLDLCVDEDISDDKFALDCEHDDDEGDEDTDRKIKQKQNEADASRGNPANIKCRTAGSKKIW